MRNIHVLLTFLVMGMLIFGCVGGAPEPPTQVSAKAVGGGIQVTWQPSPSTNIAGYNVYRSTTTGTLGSKMNSALVTASTYTDNNVNNGVTYYYAVRAVDTSGTEDTNTNQASATAQITEPTAHIKINNGAQYTSSTDVTLDVTATGASQCRFSNDGNTWGSWQTYSTQVSWTLTSGDGHKDVYVECKDSIGNTGIPTSSSIYLDSRKPSVTISSPEAGQSYSGEFDLKFTVTDPISSTITCTGKLDNSDIAIGVVTVGQLDTISVDAAQGEHTITINCDDGVNTAEASVSFSVSEEPEVSIHIESGAGHVSTSNVMIDLTAKSAQQCRLANDGTVNWGSWFTYTGTMTVPWTLSSGTGTKYVFAECKNEAGAVSDPVSDSVDVIQPQSYISIQINNGAGTTNDRNVRLGLYCYNAYECRYSNDEDSWSSWSSYTTSKNWELSSGEGTKYVYYNCRDQSGTDLGSANAHIKYKKHDSENKPSGLTIMINHGASHTTSVDVGLQLYAKYANECRFSNEDMGWSGWYSYGTSKDWTLSDGGGRKTVYYQCRNDYGTSSSVYASIYLDTGPPPPVTDLRATVYDDEVSLRWSRPSSDIVTYNIYRSTHSLGLFSKIASTRSVSYIDSSVVAGEGYSYTVRGVDSAGNEAEDSNVASVDIPGDLPLGPGPVVGGDEDEHGCKTSAGYSWCEAKQKCLRTWEEACEEETGADEPLTGAEEPGPTGAE